MLPPHQQLVSDTTTTHPSTPHLSHIRRHNTEGEHEDNRRKGASVIFLVFILLTAVAATGFDANTVEYGRQQQQQLPMRRMTATTVTAPPPSATTPSNMSVRVRSFLRVVVFPSPTITTLSFPPPPHGTCHKQSPPSDTSTLLVFEGGDCLRAPAPTTTLEH